MWHILKVKSSLMRPQNGLLLHFEFEMADQPYSNCISVAAALESGSDDCGVHTMWTQGIFPVLILLCLFCPACHSPAMLMHICLATRFLIIPSQMEVAPLHCTVDITQKRSLSKNTKEIENM